MRNYSYKISRNNVINYFAPKGIPNNDVGKIILFLHGAGGSHKHWNAVLAGLSDNLFPICIDLPGHGDSSGSFPDEMDKLLNQLEDFISGLALKKPIHIVGHSLGGLIAQGLYLRMMSSFDKMILISSAANIMLHPSMIEQMTSGEWDFNFIENGLAASLSVDDKSLIKNDLLKLNLDRSSSHPLGVADANFEDLVKEIKTSVLLIYGDTDRILSPRKTRNLVKLLSSSTLVCLNGVGHYPHLESAAAVAAALNDFCSNSYG